MKLIKYFITSIIFIIVICGIVLYYKPVTLIEVLKFTVANYFSNIGEIKIGHINHNKEGKNNIYNIDYINFSRNGEDIINLSDIKIKPDWSSLVSSLKINAFANVGAVRINNKNVLFKNHTCIINYQYEIFKRRDKFDIFVHHDPSQDKKFSFRCNIKNDISVQRINNCMLKLGSESKIEINQATLSNNYLLLELLINNIDLNFYNQIISLLPSSHFLHLVNHNAMSAQITDGQLSFNLKIDKIANKDKIDKEEISGNLNIKDLDIKYYKDFPPLKGVSGKASFIGDEIYINIDDGFISKSNLAGSTVKILWNNDSNQNVLIIDGHALGPSSDLIKFISKTQLDILKAKFIDLETIEGESETHIDIIIPLNKYKNNIYNIRSKASYVAFNLLKYLKVRNGVLDIYFNGHALKCKGEMNINHCPGKIRSYFNLNEIDSWLEVDTTLCPQFDLNHIIDIKSGHADMLFKWNKKLDKQAFALNADLQNLDILFKYPTIYKSLGLPLILSLDAKFNKLQEIEAFIIKLSDQGNIDIAGKILYGKNKDVLYDFPIIKSKTNDFSIHYNDSHAKKKLTIKGSMIDLSNSNITRFFDFNEYSDNQNLDFFMEVKEINMNNHINYSNFISYINYAQGIFKAGNLSTKMGQDDIEFNLYNLNNKEKLTIKSSNGGNFIKSLGIYDGIENGKLEFMWERSKLAKDIIGSFQFKNFLYTNPPAMLKIASITSFGFLTNLLTNKDEIKFDILTGKFKQKNNNNYKIYATKGEGKFFDFTMNGLINFTNRSIALHGIVIPNLLIIDPLIKPIPIIKDISLGIRAALGSIISMDATSYKINSTF